MVLAVLPEDPPSSGWGGDTPLMTSLRRHLLATLLDVSVVTLMATQGWLMAPISPTLVAAADPGSLYAGPWAKRCEAGPG
jgi:hypothetical protein